MIRMLMVSCVVLFFCFVGEFMVVKGGDLQKSIVDVQICCRGRCDREGLGNVLYSFADSQYSFYSHFSVCLTKLILFP